MLDLNLKHYLYINNNKIIVNFIRNLQINMVSWSANKRDFQMKISQG